MSTTMSCGVLEPPSLSRACRVLDDELLCISFLVTALCCKTLTRSRRGDPSPPSSDSEPNELDEDATEQCKLRFEPLKASVNKHVSVGKAFNTNWTRL